MPESKNRRRSRNRPPRARRSGTATTSRLRQVGAGPAEPLRRARIRPRTWRRIRRWGFIGAASLIGVLVILSFALSSFPGGFGGRGGGASQAVEGVGTPVPIIGAGHVAEGEPVSYSTTPPTSGPHWPRWADCGIYDEELPDERITHNLEHGNVVISYNLPDPQEARRLRKVVEDLPGMRIWGIVRPYSQIEEGTVAMAAWGVIDKFQGVDEGRIRTFFDTYRGYGGAPELIPCNQ